MLYYQQQPADTLSAVIKRFWMADSQGDRTIRQQKIIPDGYPEFIFHYGDPYRIKIHKNWEVQDSFLVAGQIRNFFYLENSGRSGMFAITLQPWALKKLFNVNMTALVDQVLPVDRHLMDILLPVMEIAVASETFEKKVSAIENWFLHYLNSIDDTISSAERAVQFLLKHHGKITVQDIHNKIGISEKSLERYFKSHIGLSAKFYSRIIRLSYIFKLVTEEKTDWSELAFLGGFYDQSHFIKNFKEFTGDEPSRYGFDEESMANFFLQP